jgi:hypothetical protein
MALGGSWRNNWLSPGPLSAPHAHLLSAKSGAARCAECHAAANGSLSSWLAPGEGSEAFATSQSAQCAACHEATVSASLATAAHGVAVQELLSEVGRPTPELEDRLRDPRAPIACAACHREHQGRDHRLMAIADNACQACHQARYESFAGDHPDFGDWPYVRSAGVAFDHAAHQAKHYPSRQTEFACVACHASDATGERQLTGDFAAMCAACHESSIAATLEEGLPLIALPGIDAAAVAETGRAPAAWPAAASDDFDGAVPVAAALLVAGEPATAAALERLLPRVDYFDVDPSERRQVEAAGVVAAALKTLVDELADDGPQALAGRLDEVLDRELSQAELASLASGLPPEVAAAFRDRWFGEGQTLPAQGGERAALLAKTPPGAWFLDESTLSLRYRAAGHADPWLRAWLDVLAEAASGPRASLAEPLLQAAFSPTAPGQCGQCHLARKGDVGRIAIAWGLPPLADAASRWTRFAHGPHLATMDCTSCHRMRDAIASGELVSEFEPLAKATCAVCHTPHAAGDSCTQCHRYH